MPLTAPSSKHIALDWFAECGYTCLHGPHIAPDFRVGERRTSVVLFRHKGFEQMDRNDRVRATYQHCCLRYVMNETMTNQSLRERFRLSEKKSESASRAIRDTLEAEKIKQSDPNQTSLRYRRYVPFWA